jgi:hypothetical protein
LLTSLASCSQTENEKKYSITTYFTNWDSSDKQRVRNFKYSYEEYNSDSNIIYQELYGGTEYFDDMWGKLVEKSVTKYRGKEKVETKREFGIAFPDTEVGRGKGKESIKYEYSNGNLIKVFAGDSLIETYKYDNLNNQTEKREMNVFGISDYEKFYYRNGLKVKSIHFFADTISKVDTFIYDGAKKLIEQYTYNQKGDKIAHKLILRNKDGFPVEEKWRKGYDSWRSRNNGEIVEDEFYQANKYHYDTKGRLLKTEYYDLGKLITVYEFVYE